MSLNGVLRLDISWPFLAGNLTREDVFAPGHREKRFRRSHNSGLSRQLEALAGGNAADTVLQPSAAVNTQAQV